MSVSRKQYEKAVKDLPALRKAEAVIKAWDDHMKAAGPAAEHMDIEAFGDDGSITGKPKETIRVAKTG